MSTNLSPSRSFNPATLGVCWLVYGIARLVLAVCLLLFTPTATVMFGALLVRVPDPYTLMSLFHFMYVGTIILLAAGGIVGILAGAALLGGRGAARKFALIAGFLCLSEVPVGTTLGVYTLIVFLP